MTEGPFVRRPMRYRADLGRRGNSAGVPADAGSNVRTAAHEPDVSRLQRAVYDAELAAALPTSDLGRELLGVDAAQPVHLARCAAYLHAVQRQEWFTAAFAGHSQPVVVVGGGGTSYADPARQLVSIGDDVRVTARDCERSCLHELAHIVTAECGLDRALREPVDGPDSSRGHHHAWRANFVLIVHMVLGRQAASRLHVEFGQWGLPMR